MIYRSTMDANFWWVIELWSWSWPDVHSSGCTTGFASGHCTIWCESDDPCCLNSAKSMRSIKEEKKYSNTSKVKDPMWIDFEDAFVVSTCFSNLPFWNPISFSYTLDVGDVSYHITPSACSYQEKSRTYQNILENCFWDSLPSVGWCRSRIWSLKQSTFRYPGCQQRRKTMHKHTSNET